MEDVKFTSPQPKKRTAFKKYLWMFFFLLIAIIGVVVWWKYYNVFGEGVKSGELNYVVKKGNIFKTYEGKLIQSGLRSRTVGSVQSYEFEFSVENDSIAKILMENSGNYFDLHYKEYRNPLPWRGFSPYIVDGILKVEKVAR